MVNLRELAWKMREDTVNIIMAGGSGHIGGDMSVMEILVSLFFGEMHFDPENARDRDRDRFILSKGHSVEAYYAVLAEKGFFPLDEVIARYFRYGSPYIGHPNHELPGIEMNSGSLGHGLPVATGMALAGRMDGRPYRVYVVMGDGELDEGSVWEGAMAAGHYGLGNLCVIIDRNRLQISGSTEDVMALECLADRWKAFGWHTATANGHDTADLRGALDLARTIGDRPTAIIADTIKGFGSPVMEGRAGWHHHLPTPEEYKQIMADLREGREAAAREPDTQPASN